MGPVEACGLQEAAPRVVELPDVVPPVVVRLGLGPALPEQRRLVVDDVKDAVLEALEALLGALVEQRLALDAVGVDALRQHRQVTTSSCSCSLTSRMSSSNPIGTNDTTCHQM